MKCREAKCISPTPADASNTYPITSHLSTLLKTSSPSPTLSPSSQVATGKCYPLPPHLPWWVTPQYLLQCSLVRPDLGNKKKKIAEKQRGGEEEEEDRFIHGRRPFWCRSRSFNTRVFFFFDRNWFGVQQSGYFVAIFWLRFFMLFSSLWRSYLY